MQIRIPFLLVLIVSFHGACLAQSMSINDLISMQKAHDFEEIDRQLQRTGTWQCDSTIEPFQKTYRWLLHDTVNPIKDHDSIELTDIGHGISPYISFFTIQRNRYDPLLAELEKKKYVKVKEGSVDRSKFFLNVSFWLSDTVAIQFINAKSKDSSADRYGVIIMTRKDYEAGFVFDP